MSRARVVSVIPTSPLGVVEKEKIVKGGCEHSLGGALA